MNTLDIENLVVKFPLVQRLMDLEAVTWFNPNTTTLAEGLPYVGLTQNDVAEAEARLQRFAPYLCLAFPKRSKRTALSSLKWWRSRRCRARWSSVMSRLSRARCG